MAGGPGANAIAQAQDLVNVGLNQNRNLIIMNQRGIAYTVPNLACPEIDMAFATAVGLPYDSKANQTQHVAAIKACHDRLVAQGVDLSAFNTAENEADFADLRKALKIKEWNVYGLSYGTDARAQPDARSSRRHPRRDHRCGPASKRGEPGMDVDQRE